MRKASGPRSIAHAARTPLVLYVEDSDDNWSVAELRLSRSYRMLRARGDREACDLLRAHGDELYVVLMDIELQGSQLDGVDLSRLIRGLPLGAPPPDFARGVPVLSVPIIFVTGYHSTLSSHLAAAGGNLVIPKPVEFMRLTRELTSMHLKTVTKG